jgi:hypothetical protein
MTLADKVRAFAPQHAALTHEIDELTRLAADIPNLEAALQYTRTSVTGTEKRLATGRERLHVAWREQLETSNASKSKDPLQKARIQQEFQCVDASWLPCLYVSLLTLDRPTR